MRLAEALAERKALDARLSSIEGRLRANARIQEGDAVSEDPERLFALLDSTAEELRTLMVRIARTNRETVVDGRPLADWKPLKKKREYRHPGWTHEEACML